MLTLTFIASAPMPTPEQSWWIPAHADAIYGAIAGGSIALLTAIVGHIFAWRRQCSDLVFEARKAEQERQLSLKRDIYIPLIEAISEANAFLGRAHSLNEDEFLRLDEVRRLNVCLSKAWLIAPHNVQLAISKVHKAFREELEAEIEVRGVLQKLERAQTQLDEKREQYVAAGLVAEKRAQEILEDAKSSQGDHQRQIDLAAIKLAEIKRLFAQQIPIWSTQLETELKSVERALATNIKNSEIYADAISSMREDLYMKTDKEFLRVFFHEDAKLRHDNTMKTLRSISAESEKIFAQAREYTV